jgi:hypothetical protein
MQTEEDVLDLFADDATDSAAAHEFFTDEPEEPAGKKGAKAALPRRPDTYVMIDDTEVGDSETVNRWAIAIESRYPVQVRYVVGVGHPTNRFGCWVFEKYSQTAGGDRKEGKHERLRLADATQMKEIYGAIGNSGQFWELVTGEGQPGPYRKGRPAVNAQGVVIEPDRGDHGPLPNECKWIEENDSAFIRYLGEDEDWPTGQWQVEKSGCEPQMLDAAQVKYVAHEILGMPKGGNTLKLMRRAVREVAHDGPLDSALLDEFADDPQGELWAAEDESEGTLALFAEEAQDDDVLALFT